MSILETFNLSRDYGKGENQVKALKNINLSIEEGKFTTIIGPSGSGKSTLLHCISGLDNISSGQVILDGNGIGVNSIKSSVEKYNGNVEISSEENSFTMIIYIPIKRIYTQLGIYVE